MSASEDISHSQRQGDVYTTGSLHESKRRFDDRLSRLVISSISRCHQLNLSTFKGDPIENELSFDTGKG